MEARSSLRRLDANTSSIVMSLSSIGAQIQAELEIWRPVLGFESLYEVSQLGRIRHVIKIDRHGNPYLGQPRKQLVSSDGYLFVQLYIPGVAKRKSPRVHVLVAHAFLGTKPKGMEINHIDGNKQNNRVENLEYCSHAQNMAHAALHNLLANNQGEHNCNAKLTDSDVYEIRRFSSLGETNVAIAKRFNVTDVLVSKIVRRKLWSHLP